MTHQPWGTAVAEKQKGGKREESQETVKDGRERGRDATVCFSASLTQNRTLLTQTV